MLVSVYMPTKNRLESLKLAVNSVLNQTHKDIELIVVDDASTDGTLHYLQHLSETDPRVQFIHQEVSKGACVARNLAIKISTGAFITGLDDDDEFKPEHVASLLYYWEFLNSQSDLKISCLYPGVLSRTIEGEKEVRKWLYVNSEDLFEGNHVGNQIFAPRENYFGAGLFDEEMPAWQDLEFFYRVLKKYGTARVMPLPTYVFDEMPRPDRISTGKKDKVLFAFERMMAKHAHNDGRLGQKLLMQVYSDHYGFDITFSDVIRFCSYGFWLNGYKTLIRKFIKRKLYVAG